MEKLKIGKGKKANRAIRAEAARVKVNEYCLVKYGTGYAGSSPCRLLLFKRRIWIVPIVLTSPGLGEVGDVGVVVVDAGSGEIRGATSREEVRTAGGKLAEENRDEINAAFLRARKA